MQQRSFLLISAVILAAFACHRPESKDQKPGNPLRTHKEAADTLRLDQAAQTKPLETEVLGTDRMQALLKDQDLSPIWQADLENGEVAPLYNGFYGPDHYRIEMFFGSVEKDESRPNVYRITGKSRFKKNITPFTGEIIIDSVTAFSDPNLDPVAIK